MPGDLFKKWLKALEAATRVLVCTLSGPVHVPLACTALKKLVLDHFVGEATIAKAGGFTKSASIIANSLPTNKRTRSGRSW